MMNLGGILWGNFNKPLEVIENKEYDCANAEYGESPPARTRWGELKAKSLKLKRGREKLGA
jgi:hypothetical protein